MQLTTFHRLRGSLRLLSAVTGAGVVVAMGALTIADQGNQDGASTASPNGWAVATVTMTPPPEAPETSFAAPTFKAVPCAKRAVYPCS
jgi:hypothetical protein